MKTPTLESPAVWPQLRRESGWLAASLTAVALALGTGAVAAGVFNAPFYRQLITEDGVVESASALLWIGAAAGLMRWLGRNRASRRILPAVGLLVFFLLCAGEEASWGQRILGFQTPAVLHSLNKQGETNLHNIGSISVFSNTFFLLSTLFFLLPRSDKWRRRYPILTLIGADATRIYLIGLATWLVIGLRFATLGFSPLSLWGHYSQMDDEIYEFFAAYSFCAFALLLPATHRESEIAPLGGSL